MKVDSNKGSCLDSGKNVLDGCRDDRDKLPLGDLAMNLLPHNLLDMPCLSLVPIFLEFIIHLIESACPSVLLPNLDPLLCKKIKALSDIHVRLEDIICE